MSSLNVRVNAVTISSTPATLSPPRDVARLRCRFCHVKRPSSVPRRQKSIHFWDNPKNTPKFGHVSRKCPLFAQYPKNAQCLANIPKMPIACGSQKRPEISWANGADDRGHTLHGHKSDPTNGELNVCVCCPSVPEKHTKQHRRGHAPLRQDFERVSDDELLI